MFDTRNTNHADLYIVDISERSPRKLVTDVLDAAVPMWSHDGKYIYFIGGAGELGWGRIYRCSPQGGHAVAISAQSGYLPQESSDGQTIYFAAKVAGKNVVKMISTKQPGKESVLKGPFPITPWNWTVAPGGIYFVPAEASKSMWFFEFATGKERQIFETGNGFSVGQSISADGRWLLYTQADGLDGDIMLVDHFR